MDSSIAEEGIIWRIVTEKIATLNELEKTWSIDDAYRCYAVISMKEDIKISQQKQAK